MHDTRAAWQQQTWVFITLEGSLRNLIKPAQRTTSGLACRNIFKNEYAQVAEAYDNYGPHKGYFVPRLEPLSTGEIGFQLHWDSLATFFDESGTISTEPAEEPTEVLTVDEILREHRSRKQAENTASSVTTPITAKFTEPRTWMKLSPREMSNNIKAEYSRREELGQREKLGEIQRTDPNVPLRWVEINQTLDQMEQQAIYFQEVLKVHRREQLHNTFPVSREAQKEIFSALDSVERVLSSLKSARGDHIFGHDASFSSYWFAVFFFGHAVREYETTLSAETQNLVQLSTMARQLPSKKYKDTAQEAAHAQDSTAPLQAEFDKLQLLRDKGQEPSPSHHGSKRTSQDSVNLPDILRDIEARRQCLARNIQKVQHQDAQSSYGENRSANLDSAEFWVQKANDCISSAWNKYHEKDFNTACACYEDALSKYEFAYVCFKNAEITKG